MTEREEFVGRFRVASRFPQYLWLYIRCAVFLIREMSGIVLDDRNVYRSSSSSAEHIAVSHGSNRLEVWNKEQELFV